MNQPSKCPFHRMMEWTGVKLPPVSEHLFSRKDVDVLATKDAPNTPETRVLEQVINYIRGFLSRPHPFLGRAGAVCPFTEKAIANDYLRMKLYTGPLEHEAIVEATMKLRDSFLNLEPTAGTERQSWTTLLKLGLFQSKLLRFYAGASRREVGWNTPEWSMSVAQSYLADVRLANRLVNGLGAKAVFVLQPILPFKRNRSRNERELLTDDLIKHSLACRTAILAGLKDLEQTEHINISDASGIFDDIKDDVFVDGIHLRQTYQTVVSKFVFTSALGVMP